MIGFVTGEVKAVIRDSVIVLTSSGVGYRIHTLSSCIAQTTEGMPLSLFTYLAVREHAEDLYGFETKEDLRWFELLLTVSGIGPRSALSIMNSVDTKTLHNAIARNEPAHLSRAVGIGKKTAEKVVLELKEKVGTSAHGEDEGATDGDLVEVLLSLGYSLKEARDAARAVPQHITQAEDKIREAIRLASGTR